MRFQALKQLGICLRTSDLSRRLQNEAVSAASVTTDLFVHRIPFSFLLKLNEKVVEPQKALQVSVEPFF